MTDLSHGDMQLTGSDLPSATAAKDAGADPLQFVNGWPRSVVIG